MLHLACFLLKDRELWSKIVIVLFQQVNQKVKVVVYSARIQSVVFFFELSDYLQSFDLMKVF